MMTWAVHMMQISSWDRKGLSGQEKTHLSQALEGNKEPTMMRRDDGAIQAEGPYWEQSSHVEKQTNKKSTN